FQSYRGVGRTAESTAVHAGIHKSPRVWTRSGQSLEMISLYSARRPCTIRSPSSSCGRSPRSRPSLKREHRRHAVADLVADPAFRLEGRIVAGFAARGSGGSYYPFSGRTLAALKKELAEFRQTKSAPSRNTVGYMIRDGRLSFTLHVLLHMYRAEGALTSEALGPMMKTNPVVIRRTMAGLRRAGIVRSEKGH